MKGYYSIRHIGRKSYKGVTGMDELSLYEMEAPVGIEPTMAELQSTALPLCYGAFNTFIYVSH